MPIYVLGDSSARRTCYSHKYHYLSNIMMQTKVGTSSLETKLLVDYEGLWNNHSAFDVKTTNVSEDMIFRVSRCLSLATNHALDLRKPDGHWCGELTSNTTMTSEQVFFKQSLGLDQKVHGSKYQRYLLSQQNADGSWGIAPEYPGDI